MLIDWVFLGDIVEPILTKALMQTDFNFQVSLFTKQWKLLPATVASALGWENVWINAKNSLTQDSISWPLGCLFAILKYVYSKKKIIKCIFSGLDYWQRTEQP